MLKGPNDRLMRQFGEADIAYVRAFLRTSNAFSTRLGFWVRDEPPHLLPAYGIVQRAKRDVGYDGPIY